MVDALLPASDDEDELNRACCEEVLRARSERSNAALKRPRPDSPVATPPVLEKKAPFDNKSLRAAVKLYCEDANAAEADHGPISEWDVSEVTDMTRLFIHQSDFNADLSKWDASKVTRMSIMFGNCKRFNSDLSKWDVSKVTRMNSMFANCKRFNADLSKWDVSKVNTTTAMFANCKRFNADLSKWDVSKVTRMDSTFANCKRFNADLTNWDVTNVGDIYLMFTGADAFDGRMPIGIVEKMHAMRERRSRRCLWNMARRLVLPLAKTRCIAYFWFELAARPRPNGEAPAGAVAAFEEEF